MRKKAYQISDQTDRRKIAEHLSQDGQLLLPLLELVCNTENAIDEVINVVGTAAVEAVLMLSAQEVAGPKHPGKSGGAVGWHGRQSGVVCYLTARYEWKSHVCVARARVPARRSTSPLMRLW